MGLAISAQQARMKILFCAKVIQGAKEKKDFEMVRIARNEARELIREFGGTWWTAQSLRDMVYEVTGDAEDLDG